LFYIIYTSNMSIEKKLDKVLLELEQYRKKDQNLIMVVPERDDYKDLPKYLFLDDVEIVKWFYQWIIWKIVSIREEIPEVLDYEWNKLQSVVISYWVLIKNHDWEEITVVIDAKDINFK